MLPKKRRIERKEFPKILSMGKRYNSPSFMMYVFHNDTHKDSKFTFSVSKKVSKSAVERNKLRRRGYSIINRYIKNIKSNYLCYFSYKKGSNATKFVNLNKEIEQLLSTSGVLSY